MSYSHIITHDYAGPQPVTVSRHLSERTAQATLARMLRSFRRAYPSMFPTRAIFPYSLRTNT